MDSLSTAIRKGESCLSKDNDVALEEFSVDIEIDRGETTLPKIFKHIKSGTATHAQLKTYLNSLPYLGYDDEDIEAKPIWTEDGFVIQLTVPHWENEEWATATTRSRTGNHNPRHFLANSLPIPRLLRTPADRTAAGIALAMRAGCR